MQTKINAMTEQPNEISLRKVNAPGINLQWFAQTSTADVVADIIKNSGITKKDISFIKKESGLKFKITSATVKYIMPAYLPGMIVLSLFIPKNPYILIGSAIGLLVVPPLVELIIGVINNIRHSIKTAPIKQIYTNMLKTIRGALSDSNTNIYTQRNAVSQAIDKIFPNLESAHKERILFDIFGNQPA